MAQHLAMVGQLQAVMARLQVMARPQAMAAQFQVAMATQRQLLQMLLHQLVIQAQLRQLWKMQM